MAKVFDSVERTAEDDPFGGKLVPLPFTLPGKDQVYSATSPKRSIWTRAQLATRSTVPPVRRAEVLIDFLRGTLSNPVDAGALEDRLLDPTDSLDLIDLYPVVNYLSGRWANQIRRINEGLDPLDPDDAEDVDLIAARDAATAADSAAAAIAEIPAQPAAPSVEIPVVTLPPVPPVA